MYIHRDHLLGWARHSSCCSIHHVGNGDGRTKSVSSNTSINCSSLNRAFGPAKDRYSKIILEKFQCWSFLRMPTSIPTSWIPLVEVTNIGCVFWLSTIRKESCINPSAIADQAWSGFHPWSPRCTSLMEFSSANDFSARLGFSGDNTRIVVSSNVWM